MPVRPYDQNQQFLLPPSLNEWIKKDHPARVFSDIIDSFNICGFQEIKSEGRPRYDTKMMLKILLWGYATGVRASRKIENKINSDTVFMWLAGLEKPDFRTICIFRRSNIAKINDIFSQVLILAKNLKLLKLGTIALDGTKVRASAAVDSFKKVKDWEKELNEVNEKVKEILQEAEQADKEDDEKYGKDKRGDEIPKELEKEEERKKKIEELLKEIEDKNTRVSGTDKEAKFMHHKNGSMPAYNCQAATNEEQIIVHEDVTTEPMDTNQLIPALDRIKKNCGKKPEKILADAGYNNGHNFREMEKQGVDGYIPEGREGNIGKEIKQDTGLYNKDDFKYDEEKDCYICPERKQLSVKSRSHKRTKYSENWIKIYSAKEKCLECTGKSKCTKSRYRTVSRGEFEQERLRMRQKLRTQESKQLYKKRKTMVEPVIGQIKTTGCFNQFLLRGLTGAKTEWKWAVIAHNILKMTRKIVRGERNISLLPI